MDSKTIIGVAASAVIAGLVGYILIAPRAAQTEDQNNIQNLPRFEQRLVSVETAQAEFDDWKTKHSSDIQHTDTLQCVHIGNVEVLIQALLKHQDIPLDVKVIDCGSGAGK